MKTIEKTLKNVIFYSVHHLLLFILITFIFEHIISKFRIVTKFVFFNIRTNISCTVLDMVIMPYVEAQ
jgi:hypothetical protein